MGPLRPLAFEKLTSETEKMYMASFNSTIDRYRELLAEQKADRLRLPNDNLDVGTLTGAGKYKLTDAVYSQLLHKLQGHYTEMPPELRGDILAFYHDLDIANTTKSKCRRLGQGAHRTRSIAFRGQGFRTSHGSGGRALAELASGVPDCRN